MNNLLSYCGLVDAKIRASDKDLPVRLAFTSVFGFYFDYFWTAFIYQNHCVIRQDEIAF